MKKRMDSLFTFLVVLLPFLYQYKSPLSSIAFGEFILIPFVLVYVLSYTKNKIRFMSFYGYYRYIVLVLLMTMFAAIQTYFAFADFFTVFLRIIYYSILIYVSYGHFQLDTGLVLVKRFTVLFSVYIIFQYVLYKSVGVILPTVLNSNWIFAPEAGIRLNYEVYYKYAFRPSSLFLEPSYYVLFASVGLSSILFVDKEKNDKFKMMQTLLITIGMVISTSSLALLILTINWFFYFYRLLVIEKQKISIKKIIIIFTFFVFAIFIFTSSLAENSLARIASGASFSQRITRGILLLKELNLYQHLVGIGINNIANYVVKNGITTPYDETNLNYVASVIGTYLSSGFVVFVSYMSIYIDAWKKSFNVLYKVLILTLFVCSFIEMNSFTYRFSFLFIFIINMYQMKKGKSEIYK